MNELKELLSALLGFLKDVPLWLMAGAATALGLFLFVPGLGKALSAEHRDWLTFAFLLFGVLTVFRVVAIAVRWVVSLRKKAEKRFHFTLDERRSRWEAAKQPDESIVLLFYVDGLAKNLSAKVIRLVSSRLVRPRIKGEAINQYVLMADLHDGTYQSGLLGVPVGGVVKVTFNVTIRAPAPADVYMPLAVELAVFDDEGNEQRIRATLPPTSKPKTTKHPEPAMEAVHRINDPIEKEVAAVLQSEMDRYDKCGRERGGLGSVHIVHDGRTITGVGGDSWTPGQPHNQSVALDESMSELRSDHLSALVNRWDKSSEADRDKMATALLNRLDPGSSYLPVAYFIVCCLWRFGRLESALTKANTLPQNDRKTHGLSNVLMLLNGLLRYRHADFSDADLDLIAALIDGMEEHTFKINEKLSAIRTLRLHNA